MTKAKSIPGGNLLAMQLGNVLLKKSLEQRINELKSQKGLIRDVRANFGIDLETGTQYRQPGTHVWYMTY